MFFKKKIKETGVVSFYSPVNGELIPLSEVEDEAFSTEVLGKGFAIKPSSNVVLSPFDGEVIMLFETCHAIGLKDHKGNEYLIHIGIDTVYLKGKGFKSFIGKGDKVKKGQKLIEFSLATIMDAGYDPVIILVCTNNVSGGNFSLNEHKYVHSNDMILEM